MGDTHVYLNHIEPLKEPFIGAWMATDAQLRRLPMKQLMEKQHLLQCLYESRFASMQRLISFFVMFHAMGKAVQVCTPCLARLAMPRHASPCLAMPRHASPALRARARLHAGWCAATGQGADDRGALAVAPCHPLVGCLLARPLTSRRVLSLGQDFWPRATFGIFGYDMSRSHSIMRIATTASPVSGMEVRMMVLELQRRQQQNTAAMRIQACYRYRAALNAPDEALMVMTMTGTPSKGQMAKVPPPRLAPPPRWPPVTARGRRH